MRVPPIETFNACHCSSEGQLTSNGVVLHVELDAEAPVSRAASTDWLWRICIVERIDVCDASTSTQCEGTPSFYIAHHSPDGGSHITDHARHSLPLPRYEIVNESPNRIQWIHSWNSGKFCSTRVEPCWIPGIGHKRPGTQTGELLPRQLGSSCQMANDMIQLQFSCHWDQSKLNTPYKRSSLRLELQKLPSWETFRLGKSSSDILWSLTAPKASPSKPYSLLRPSVPSDLSFSRRADADQKHREACCGWRWRLEVEVELRSLQVFSGTKLD